MTALIHAEDTGEGQHIDVAIAEYAITVTAGQRKRRGIDARWNKFTIKASDDLHRRSNQNLVRHRRQ